MLTIRKQRGTLSNFTKKSIDLYAKRMSDSLVAIASFIHDGVQIDFGRKMPLTAPRAPEFKDAVIDRVLEIYTTRRTDWSALMILYMLDENNDEYVEVRNTSCSKVTVSEFEEHMKEFHDSTTKAFVRVADNRHCYGWAWVAIPGLVTAEEWEARTDAFIDQFDTDAMFEKYAKQIGADVEVIPNE